MAQSEQAVYSVSEFTVYLRRLIEKDTLMQNVWIEGELSNVTVPASGHLYFTLKDENSQLKAVMWKSQLASLRFKPAHGAKVRAHGKISVYDPRGEYQLYCDFLQPLDAIGDLHAEFRRRWDRLEQEGLFAPEIKRPLPAFPTRIGVVTSPTAAAFQDIQNVLRRRYPLATVILSATPVQGDDAPPQIIQALRRLDHYGVDVILLARGGGSLEDLWCFNDERLARALRATRAPVVTGVGHETDTTLVDGTADRRAPTPSAGAEMITPNIDDLRDRLGAMADQMADAVQNALDQRVVDLDAAEHKLRLVSPLAALRNYRQRVDELDARLVRGSRAMVNQKRALLANAERTLERANPLHLLARGYAIVSRGMDGKRITDVMDAAPGTSLDIQLNQGRLKVTVKERTQ